MAVESGAAKEDWVLCSVIQLKSCRADAIRELTVGEGQSFHQWADLAQDCEGTGLRVRSEERSMPVIFDYSSD